MFIRSTLVLASLALPLAAQDAEIKAASAQDDGAAAFYKAYFLDNTQTRSKAATNKALGLYSRFLANHADHKLAGQAANRMLVLLYATGSMDKASAHAKKYSAQIAKVNEEARAARGNRGRRGGGEDNPNREIIAKLREASQNAEGAERTAISAAMRRLGSRRGFGGRGGGFGGRGGGRGGRGGRRGMASIPKIADMKPDEAKNAVEKFVTSMERIIDLLATQGKADQADKLEAKLDKVQDLVDDGKLKEAQKILDSFQDEMGNVFRRGGRGGGGGDQGGRRRRGGGDGGDTGGRRRRGGGDGKIK